MIESSSGTLFPQLKIELTHIKYKMFPEAKPGQAQNKKNKTVEQVLKESRPKKREDKLFDFILDLDIALGKKVYTLKGHGVGKNGDDCLWIPLSKLEGFDAIEAFGDKKVGLKIVPENNKYKSLEVAGSSLSSFREMDLDFLPSIYGHETITSDNKKYLLVLIEEVVQDPEQSLEKKNFKSKYLTDEDFSWLKSNIALNPEVSDIFTTGFYNAELNPEDEWYKKNNFHNLKIIDFQRFVKHEDRYRFPTNKTPEEIDEIYQNSLKKYTSILDSSGLPKWKGTLYQGMRFSNGYEIKGYSSDSKYYDSYRKLPYIPLNKADGKKVIDIGCNQGFFSFQAALHGAREVVGIDIQEEDIATANDIKDCIDLPEETKVNFIVGDAVKYIESLSREDDIGLIIANSVIHQIFPNFKGASNFLHKVSCISPYFVLETPANHKKMNLNMKEIFGVLNSHFSVVRCLYVYDAYSSGYRVIFSCSRDSVGDEAKNKKYPRLKYESPASYQNEIRKFNKR